MSLPFFWVSLGFSLGIVVEKYWSVPTLWIGYALFVGMVFLGFLRGQKCFWALFVILLGCAGILWARLDVYVPENAVRNYTGPGRVTLRGVVRSLPEIKTHGKKTSVSLVLGARSITRQEGRRRKFCKISGNVQVFLLQSSFLPQVGDELRLYGELRAPRAVLNPGEFDYGAFLAQKNIYAIFQTIGQKSVRVIRSGSRFLPERILAEIRRNLAILIDRLYATPEAAVLKALVLGLRSDVTPEVRDQFMKTGTIHVIPT